MIRQTNKTTKSMDLDYSDDYRASMDFDNPYGYSFGRINKEHIHTYEFSRLQNRVNADYFYKR